MSRPVTIKDIPVEVMGAVHRHLPLYSKHQILIAMAAGLGAWPGMDVMPFGDAVTRIRLPLTIPAPSTPPEPEFNVD